MTDCARNQFGYILKGHLLRTSWIWLQELGLPDEKNDHNNVPIVCSITPATQIVVKYRTGRNISWNQIGS